MSDSSPQRPEVKEGIVLDREGRPLGAATRKVEVVWGGYRRMGLIPRLLTAPLFIFSILLLLAFSVVIMAFLALGAIQRKVFRPDR